MDVEQARTGQLLTKQTLGRLLHVKEHAAVHARKEGRKNGQSTP